MAGLVFMAFDLVKVEAIKFAMKEKQSFFTTFWLVQTIRVTYKPGWSPPNERSSLPPRLTKAFIQQAEAQVVTERSSSCRGNESEHLQCKCRQKGVETLIAFMDRSRNNDLNKDWGNWWVVKLGYNGGGDSSEWMCPSCGRSYRIHYGIDVYVSERDMKDLSITKCIRWICRLLVDYWFEEPFFKPPEVTVSGTPNTKVTKICAGIRDTSHRHWRMDRSICTSLSANSAFKIGSRTIDNDLTEPSLR